MKKAIATLIATIIIVHIAALSVLVVSVAVAAKLCLLRCTPKPHR
jgi:hypothetical protein